MKKRKHKEPTSGALTNRMDIGSDGFNELQAILLNKSRERSKEQKLNIELLALKFKMEDYLKSEMSDEKLAGEFLKSYLKTLHIHQNAFAKYIGINPTNLSKMIKGERPINHEFALIFGKLFNMKPILWIEIQAKNELKRLEVVRREEIKDYSLNDLIAEY